MNCAGWAWASEDCRGGDRIGCISWSMEQQRAGKVVYDVPTRIAEPRRLTSRGRYLSRGLVVSLVGHHAGTLGHGRGSTARRSRRRRRRAEDQLRVNYRANCGAIATSREVLAPLMPGVESV